MSELKTPDNPGEPEISGLSRRSFVKRGLLGGVLLAIGASTVVALRKGATEPAAPRPLQTLEPGVFPVLVAVAKCVIPEDAAPSAAVDVALAIDENLSYTGVAAKDYNALLGILENGLAGWLTRGSATPFTLLTVEQQRDALMRWRDSRVVLLNTGYNGLRKSILASYYADLARAQTVGYPGPVFETPDPGAISPRARLSPPYVPAGAKENP